MPEKFFFFFFLEGGGGGKECCRIHVVRILWYFESVIQLIRSWLKITPIL